MRANPKGILFGRNQNELAACIVNFEESQVNLIEFLGFEESLTPNLRQIFYLLWDR